MITTNYDTGIEEAAKQLKKKLPSQFNLPKVQGIIGLEKIPDLNQNGIFKIHGCSALDPPKDLILTTTQEAAGLPIGFRKVLSDIFKDSLVVFMGYSASEPDCMEALLDTDQYDVIWVSADDKILKKNERAKTIIGQAKNAYHVIDLEPFISTSSADLGLNSLWKYLHLTDGQDLTNPSKSKRTIHLKKGITLYKKLLRASGLRREQVLKSILEALFYLREFRLVDIFLDDYGRLKRHSKFYARYTKAGMIRDRNDDWQRARDVFVVAHMQANNDFERALSNKERLGQEILLAQNDRIKLGNLRKEIETLSSYAENKSKHLAGQSKTQWLIITRKKDFQL